MKKKGSQFKVGLVVLLGLVVLGLGIFYVSGGKEWFANRKLYRIHFHNAGGIGGGAPVYLAGRYVGKVAYTKPWKEARQEGGVVYKGVIVLIEIDEGESIQEDSTFTIEKSLTGSLQMNIQYGKGKSVEPGEVRLMGKKLASYEEAVDEAAEMVKQTRGVVRTVQTTVNRVDDIVTELQRKDLPASLDHFIKTLGDTASLAQATVQELRPQLVDTLKSSKNAASELQRTAKDAHVQLGDVLGEAKDALASLKQAAGKVDGIVSENRETIRSLLQKFDDAAQRLPATLDKLESVVSTTDRTMGQVSPKLVEAVAHARDAMKNFDALTEDLRTAPWKLINKPSETEVKEIHLFNAARLYVSATSEVEDAVANLKALQSSGAFAKGQNSQDLANAFSRLQSSLENYDRREKKLVQWITEKSKN